MHTRARSTISAAAFRRRCSTSQYPAPGDPALARAIVEKLTAFGAQLDDSWGLDHGAWSVLSHMYPDADVPIVQVSLDMRRAPEEHYAIAQALADLRDDNILVLGSRQHRAQSARLLPRAIT